MLNELLNFLKREGDFSFWKSITFMAVLSGLANAGLLALINLGAEVSEDEGLNYRFLAIYIVIFLIFFIAKRYSILHSTQEIEKIIKNIRERISDKVKRSELSTLENIEKSNIFVSLTRDTTTLSQSAIALMNTSQSIVMIFFAFLYILFISKLMFFIIILSITFVIIAYSFFAEEFNRDLMKTNSVEARFFSSLDSAIYGFKELKMNTKKRDDFASEHNRILDKLFNLKVNLNNKFITNMMFTEVFLYILLGTIVFIIPHFTTEKGEDVIKVTAAMLFIIGPLDSVVATTPLISKSVVAIKEIYALEGFLDQNAQNEIKSDAKMQKSFQGFNQIRLKDVDFHYLSEGNEKVFGIQHINLEINKGEIVFIIGGNGSGKSTLTKVLLGLYHASSGEILVDDTPLSRYNSEAYRNLFSIILTDFYLFERLYGVENIDYQQVDALMHTMQLQNKSEFIEGAFTNTKLSTGQRKRLALVSVLLEDKEIYVFDEWAADQDPEFRKYFYTTILKELQARGKTIIAVTHDDAYFHVANKVYQMDYGKIRVYPKK